MTSDVQIRAFIDRILRLKEEQDTIGEDIRDIYAEAKSMGFDKTALGNVVAHLRKVAKKGHDTVAEQGAIFDLYLCAYEGKSPHAPAPARVRENIEQFDPTTGEIIEADVSAKLVETIATGVQTEVGRAALIAAVDIMIAREEAEETQERPSTNDEASPEAGPQAEASPAGTGAGTLADREGRREGEAASVGLPTSSEIPSDVRDTDREAADTLAGANAGGEDVDRSAERASVATSSGPDVKWAQNSPETANEVPAQDGRGSASGESPCGKSNAARPASVDAQPNGRGSVGEAEESVVTVVGTESGTVANSPETAEFHAKASDDACEAGRKTLGRAEASAEAPDGVELVSRGVGDRAPTATSENGRDSLERQAPSFIAKPKSALRPNCRNPEVCSGYGDQHCHGCTVAMREKAEEVA